VIGWLAILLACGLVGQLRGDTPAGPDQALGTALAAEFPSLEEAYRPVREFIVPDDPQQEYGPCWRDTPIVAFEENSHFLYAKGNVVQGAGSAEPPLGQPGESAFIGRFFCLKPSVFVIDLVFRGKVAGKTIEMPYTCRGDATATGRQLRISGSERELLLQLLSPEAGEFHRKSSGVTDAAQTVYQFDLQPPAGAKEVRMLQVVYVREKNDTNDPPKSVLEDHDGTRVLTITAADRVLRLELPPPDAGAGWVTLAGSDGRKIIPRRPLPTGILPHGPQGMQLIERWDRAYRDGRRPAWDTGIPAGDLKEAVENGSIRPGRTVVLGCGSGTNAIYLASKGFDVTAIDVAPTCLGIAEEKANKAGVRVRWVLADVLNLPQMEPFDFIFDRGCYHNVRYVDATAFVESVRRLSHPGTRFFILSLNRDGPPGVREQTMRDDFSSLFDFEWLRESNISTGPDGNTQRNSWSLMLRRKDAD
jgi:SAM-dependent methyltransferase